MHNNNMYEWGSISHEIFLLLACISAFDDAYHVQSLSTVTYSFSNKNTFEIGGAAALRQLHQLVRTRYPIYTLLSIESGTEYFFNYLQAETYSGFHYHCLVS